MAKTNNGIEKHVKNQKGQINERRRKKMAKKAATDEATNQAGRKRRETGLLR